MRDFSTKTISPTLTHNITSHANKRIKEKNGMKKKQNNSRGRKGEIAQDKSLAVWCCCGRPSETIAGVTGNLTDTGAE